VIVVAVAVVVVEENGGDISNPDREEAEDAFSPLLCSTFFPTMKERITY